MSHARGQHIARQIYDLRRRQLQAQKGHAGVDQVMRLVEHHHVHCRQQFSHAGVAQLQVGKEQVMVDHHHVGGHRFTAGAHDMAGPEVGARRPQAVVARRGHQGQHGRAFIEAFDFREVAGRGCHGPPLDAGQRAHGHRRGTVTGARLLHAVEAQVAVAPLQQRRLHRRAQGLRDARQVTQEKLLLQALRRRADEGSAPRQQHRHQVGEGFADAGAGLDHQRIARADGVGNRVRHANLRVTPAVAAARGKWPIFGKGGPHGRAEIDAGPCLWKRCKRVAFVGVHRGVGRWRRHAGSGGSTIRSSFAI